MESLGKGGGDIAAPEPLSNFEQIPKDGEPCAPANGRDTQEELRHNHIALGIHDPLDRTMTTANTRPYISLYWMAFDFANADDTQATV